MAPPISANSTSIPDVLNVKPNRKRVEESVCEGEERFRQIADAAPAMIWLVGTDKLCTYVNKRCLEFTGRALERDIGNGWVENVHPDDAKRCAEEYEQHFDRRERFTMEYRMRRYDGQYRWILDNGVPRYNEDGSFAGYVGSALDVTERKITEDALRASEERSRLAAQVAKMFAYEWDILTDAVVRTPEPTPERDEPREMTGQQLASRIYPEDRATASAAIAALSRENPTYHLTYRLIRPSGNITWQESHGVGHFDDSGKLLRVIGMTADITKRKLAEESQARLAAIVESSEDAIISKALDGIITSWNTGAQHLFGYTSEEVIGRPVATIIPPELRDEEGTILAKVRSGERIQHFETVRVTKAGKKINVSLSISPIRDAAGKIVGASKIARDITEQKQAVEALRIMNERLHLAMEAGSAGGWDFDLATGKNVWFGEAHVQLGLTHDETLGSVAEFWGRVHEDDRARLEQALQISKEKHEAFAEEFRVVWRDGTTHWLRSRGRYYYAATGEPERMLGISIDITESKKADEALLGYAAIVESSVDAISSVTLDGVIVTWNEGAQRMFGYTENEAVGKPATIHVPPELRDQQRNEIFRTLWAGGRIEQFETVRVSKTGKRIDVSLSISPIKDSTGKIVGCAGIARDITERKSAERELMDVRRRLAHAQEEERARIGRELHDDINQRLAMLAMEIDQLQNQFPKSAAQRNSRLTDLKQRLIDVSSGVQSLSHQLHPAQLQYLGLVGAVRSFCRDFSERQTINVDFTAEHVPKEVPYDFSLCLFRVLQEAIHNASKHGMAQQIKVSLSSSSTELQLTISDNGKGFDPDKATTHEGLGLISMRERIRLIGGLIAVRSAPGSGTMVRVTAPLLPPNDFSSSRPVTP